MAETQRFARGLSLPTDDQTYGAARRVLLNALEALAHKPGLIVVGAQAIYLRIGPEDISVAPFTTDGDIALDPTLLGEDPTVELAMRSAGFQLLGGGEQPGMWIMNVEIGGVPTSVPVDLMVPEAVCPAKGSRDAHIDDQGRRVARRAVGLEATLFDKSVLAVAALEAGDSRCFHVAVAELPSLLVAKVHKIQDRVQDPTASRQKDKDGGDVYRIMQNLPAGEAAGKLSILATHEVAGPVVVDAVKFIERLFGRESDPGVQAAQRALGLGVPPSDVAALCVAWTRELLRRIA